MGYQPDKSDDESGLHEKAASLHSEQQQLTLRKILRARTRLIVCFLTLPVYMISLWILLNNQRGIESFMYIYMALWSGFAVDMALRRCPECHHQFFVKSVLLNLITRRCVHCGYSTQEKSD